MSDSPSEPLDARLRRLKTERDRADTLYNDALTALDQAVRPPLDLPPLPGGFDDAQVTPLNESWNVLGEAPVFGSGVRGRMGRFVWGIVEPYL
ncbi:MAG: hypothetical protein H0X67_07770, partial [Acidobacteria bacterium]|nr:hypothetical protein [Acidobacteriota bacterium]